jgi:hypothetical protein
MSSEEHDEYYEKYLKYKLKYLELQDQAGGLLTLQSGVFAFFCGSEAADSICTEVYKASPSVAKINQILSKSGIAYRGKNGDTKLTVVAESLLRKGLAKTQVLAGRAASATVSSGKALARSIKRTGSNLKQKVSEKIRQIKEKRKAKQAPTEYLDDAGVAAQEGGDSAQEGGSKSIGLRKPLNINDEDDLMATLSKLHAKNPTIDTAVVIDIRKAGANKCLKKISI